MQTLDPSTPLEQVNTPARPTPLAARLYTRRDLLRLFLVCAFPLHLWTLLMAFRDFGWVALRTEVWDAVGLLAYALFIALIESVLVFLLAALIGLLLPWHSEKRTALAGALFLVLSFWSILAKTFLLFGSPLSPGLTALLQSSSHPVRILWGAAFLAILLTVVLPALWIARSPRASSRVTAFFDNLTTLSAFYLFLDLLALLVIVVRNLSARFGA